MKETKMYLSCLDNVEKAKMTIALDFLHNANSKSKNELISLAADLYSQDTKLTFLRDNGKSPSESSCHTSCKDKYFFTLIQFERKDVTDEVLKELGSYDGDWGWRYFYAISLGKEDRGRG